MIDPGLPQYFFIRTCVFVLRFLPLHLAIACVVLLIFDHDAYGLIKFFQIYAIVEIFFYVIIYVPRSRWLQAPATHPPLLSKAGRKELYAKCNQTVTDGEEYLSLWFCGASTRNIKRDNVKEFFAWALLNTSYWGEEDEEELEEYTNGMEQLLDRRLEPGRNPNVKPIKLTLDPVPMLHRPLTWYCIVALVDNVNFLYLWFHGFQFHRLPLLGFFNNFPLRTLSLATRHVSPSGHFSYWYRPHTSRTRLPLLFIHGIGIGMIPYRSFLSSVNSQSSGEDGDIGVLAIELLPICNRMTSPLPSTQTIIREILIILAQHSITKFVLAAHSYGSVLAAHLHHHPATSRLISATMLVDPVCFLLHHPHIAYNFCRRQPRRANEWQLYYFGSMDAMTSHTLARHFFWAENTLWRDDLRGKDITVVLGGRDLIVDTLAVGRYLGAEDGENAVNRYGGFMLEGEDADDTTAETGAVDSWKTRDWKGEGLDVIWVETADHSQVYERKDEVARMVGITRAYCASE